MEQPFIANDWETLDDAALGEVVGGCGVPSIGSPLGVSAAAPDSTPFDALIHWGVNAVNIVAADALSCAG